MPIFINTRSTNPILSLIIGLASIAVFIGLVYLLLPVILGVALAVVIVIMAIWLWAWCRAKFGKTSQSAEEQLYRDIMMRAEAQSREQYQYRSEQRSQRLMRQNMQNVEEAHIVDTSTDSNSKH